MQDIPVLSLVCLTMTPLRIGSSKFFSQSSKSKSSQLKLAIIFLHTFQKASFGYAESTMLSSFVYHPTQPTKLSPSILLSLDPFALGKDICFN